MQGSLNSWFQVADGRCVLVLILSSGTNESVQDTHERRFCKFDAKPGKIDKAFLMNPSVNGLRILNGGPLATFLIRLRRQNNGNVTARRRRCPSAKTQTNAKCPNSRALHVIFGLFANDRCGRPGVLI